MCLVDLLTGEWWVRDVFYGQRSHTSVDFVVDEYVLAYLRWFKAKGLAQYGQAESAGAVVFRWERRVILLGFGLSAHLH